jgi:hypothetical protein
METGADDLARGAQARTFSPGAIAVAERFCWLLAYRVIGGSLNVSMTLHLWADDFVRRKMTIAIDP